MATFAQMKSFVSKRLIDPSNTAVSSADVGDAINDAIRFWKYQRFWFNENSHVAIMTINNPKITGQFPSDFLVESPENGFVINYNNLSYTMVKKPPREYDALNVRGIGIPFIYTYRDEDYEFYFYPNIAYEMTIWYLRDYTDLSSDSDTNDFTTYADRLICYHALARLSGELRQDGNMAAYYESMAEKEKINLLMRTSKQTESGKLSVETIL